MALAQWLLADTLWVAVVGMAAFIGHCFPVYYQFQGGKGVATAIGFIVAFHWPTGLAVIAIWIIIAKVFKLSSLAALIAFALMPVIYFGFSGNGDVTTMLGVLTLILIWRHRQNIQRLIQGEEH